ncbi:hypothetical protein KTAU_39680 [Thermogemmatispora aurantia]|jgi:hypothetical protein|uniref:Big-1 domain-containing protein n=1 Tax=Thermogemmatispora aurantia TaxID=2045279 RepID=A0A5J4KCQ1_9CHLR|nr:hypothetical protein [Thermogemmatispora aurantia]GER85333.1 hypothetical protein KTAU_39680 [Thermogemmatispora aurantia]
MKKTFPSSIYKRALKFSSLGLFLAFCVVIVACGNNSSQANLESPSVTATIVFGTNDSPTPSLPDYLCGAWATDTSPQISSGKMIMVYAKFVHTVDGNPVGVGDATATATVRWWDGSVTTQTVQTTSDGLAVFSIPPRADAVGKLTLVNVTFSKEGTPGCTVPQAAYFTISSGGTATATKTASPQATSGPTQETPTPTATSTAVPFPTVTITVTFPPGPPRGTATPPPHP